MKPKRRWHRVVIPIALALATIGGIVTAHWLDSPDASEAHYLSPQLGKQEPTSAVELAEMLRAKGITVRRETKTSEALTATWSLRGEVTLFIPAPRFVHADYLWMLRHSPASTRVVLVEPGERQLFDAVPAIVSAGTRWATEVTARGDGCQLTGAGPAAVTRTRYARYRPEADGPTAHSCYDNGLVSINYRNVEFVIAGSDDPFRSDRMAEHDNARLAVDLLSTKRNVVWLDLHEREPKPKTFNENPPGAGTPIPSFQPGRERQRDDASPRPRESIPPVERREQAVDEAPPPDPWPKWLVPVLLLLLLAGILLALARGRRLGPPVTEPLPIDVRGAETAIGRSHLYRRAKARGPALETLRIEARRRLAAALRTGADRDRLLDAVAQRTGQPREALQEILYGSEPQDDAELHARTTELLHLVQWVTREKP